MATRVFESMLVGVAGALVAGGLGLWILGPAGAVAFGLVGGVSGGFSGYRAVYRWDRWTGWVAFVLDSTWALVGTFLAVLLHVANLVWPGAAYRQDCSTRQNRHVYFGGAAARRGYAFTQGNVISNADSGRGVVRPRFLKQHEEWHIWQNRMFGPLFQGGYVAWAVLGFLVASVVWLFRRTEPYYGLLETAVYYDNPYEYWAYVRDGNWPHPSANRTLSWPRPAEQNEEAQALRRNDRAERCEPPG